MIPILYDKDETAFASNGLGRLRDMISCVVTEERNGVYECDFEYPVSADDFNDIQIGRIVGVTHDESDDIQPFDIVSFSRPIDGVVSFHCTHISYRQSYLTVTGSNINSLSAAFTLLGTATPTNPFTYETDKTSTGYLASADGVPKTVRSMLGGIEGSILDAYGGEYEWDKWRVILHSARGQQRNFSIRYGVNMLDYNEDYDASGTYMSCIPYWTDGTTTVVGDRQDSGGSTVTGRGECVPLDVSDKFDSSDGAPTKAQVNSMGLSVISSKNPMIPSQNIHVEFVRLQDMGYENLENLLECKLCDTINVIFPFYNTSGQFKIVKTVWDVLSDRYESMELGDLSVTLAEALGISNGEGSLARGGNTDLPSYTNTPVPIAKLNGQTLMRRVFTGNTPTSSGGTVFSDACLDTLVTMSGYVLNTGNSRLTLPAYYTSASDYMVMYAQSGVMKFAMGNTGVLGNRPYVCIVDYLV